MDAINNGAIGDGSIIQINSSRKPAMAVDISPPSLSDFINSKDLILIRNRNQVIIEKDP